MDPNPISQSLTHAPALLSVVLVHVFQIAPLRILDIYAYIIAMGYIFCRDVKCMFVFRNLRVRLNQIFLTANGIVLTVAANFPPLMSRTSDHVISGCHPENRHVFFCFSSFNCVECTCCELHRFFLKFCITSLQPDYTALLCIL
jgi:hypothetical protein